ncbi:hypothetical protein FO488_08900 [Geobacter sp. FeAm09]|nr:hypothetical protein FO488_08900 [Geobacter sp. FeAm09]
MEESVTGKPVQRLCSEIQLFDLCERERCDYKQDRFCTNEDLLVRFERISEKDDTRPAAVGSYRPEGQEDGDDLDEDVYGEDDALDDRDDDDLDGGWEDD